MRQFDLQRIRKEHNVTQKAVSQMTGYPQGFVSVIESRKASAPEAFIEKIKELFKIEDITPYIIYVPNEEIRAAKNGKPIVDDEPPATQSDPVTCDDPTPAVPVEPVARQSLDQEIVASFLEMLKKKEAKIEKLEAQIEMLKAQLVKR